MQCVAFEYVLDFELERPTSAKSLEMKYILQMKAKLFAALSMVLKTKNLWSASSKISVIRFKNNEKYSLYFYYRFSFFTYIFFYFGECPSCEK